jgi:hypothetical protein
VKRRQKRILNKRKALGFLRVIISRNVHILDLPILFKQLADLARRRVERQISNVETVYAISSRHGFPTKTRNTKNKLT